MAEKAISEPAATKPTGTEPFKGTRDIKLKLAIGEEVQITATGKPGTIKSIHQDEAGTIRYAVSYNDDNGDEQRGWFEAAAFTPKN